MNRSFIPGQSHVTQRSKEGLREIVTETIIMDQNNVAVSSGCRTSMMIKSITFNIILEFLHVMIFLFAKVAIK